jgi:hypothetical protein
MNDGLCWEDAADNRINPSSGQDVQLTGNDAGVAYWFPSLMQSEGRDNMAMLNN